MSGLSNISVRFRHQIQLSSIILIAIFSGAVFLHTMNTSREFDQLQQELIQAVADADSVKESIELYFITDVENSGPAFLPSDAKKLLENIEAHYGKVLDNYYVKKNPELSKTFLSYKKDIKDYYTSYSSQNLSALQADSLAFIRAYPDEIFENLLSSQWMLASFIETQKSGQTINLLIIQILTFLIILLLVLLNNIKMNMNLAGLIRFLPGLDSGTGSTDLNLSGGSEFRDLETNLKQYVERQRKKIHYLKTLGEGGSNENFNPAKNDILGSEIKVLAERLKKVQTEEDLRKKEEEKQRWATEGIAQFAEILRSERENVSELSFVVIQKLVTYLHIEMGAIMLADSDEEGRLLETIASYAYDRRKYLNKKFRFGEGLPGTCALEKEKIYINEIPEEYSDIISGVGYTKPRFVLVVPMKIEEEIFGIIELASFRELAKHELDFIDQLAESIASTLQAVKINEKTAFLLRQSREQAEQLLRQEEEMKLNMMELEKAQEESLKKESEITGILNAMNKSSLVAEFGLNGRFTHINDKFLELLDSPAEQVLGKHHNEFAVVEKYSEAYKKFWSDLKEGIIISRTDQLKLYNGKSVWLQQTFTPIKNSEGKVFKILNIAVDVTPAIVQQDSLEKQASEIKRRSLEMESFSEAVNTSIIKCELDHEGIILDVNKNFEDASGYNRKELLGRNYLLFLKELEKEQFEKIWQEILKGKTYEGAIRRTKPTGEEVWLMSTFSPVLNEEGVIYKTYFLALDITEKRLKYQLLEEANKEIERLRKR